ncbi:MAG TPA: carboxymuconolactone decarboxylase family protein [Candidatus Binataceae bacterium]|nr:carboxymuconolactone decarboxylase family protein [Candidatus Binataceae bacterium]
MISRKQRLSFCDLSSLDDQAREMAERSKVNGQVLNLFKILLNHPKLVRAWGRFGNYILGGSTLSAREREIAILRIGWLNQAEYEWEQHVLIGKRAGISDAEIEQITKGPKAGWNRHEAALVQAADDLFENSIVSDETWKTLAETYNTQQMMDLVFSIGQYNLVSWALNSFGVPLDDFLPGAKKK